MAEAFRDLSADDIRQLANALRAGRLSPPFSTIAVQRYLPDERGALVAAELQRLAEEGLGSCHLALTLDLLASDRANRQQVLEAIEVVTTGPEVPGASLRDTSVVVRELFASAVGSVLVAGYAVHQGQHVFQVLAQRMDADPDLRVRMFLDVQRHPTDTSKASEILARFAHRFKTEEWPGRRLPEVFYDPRALETDRATRGSLHAKCIVVDRTTAFISSANFTLAAQERNIEVGVLLRIPAVACQIATHFEGMAASGILDRIPGF